MIKSIVKRDGRTTEFNKEKIAQAIQKAFEATTGKKDYESERVSSETEKKI